MKSKTVKLSPKVVSLELFLDHSQFWKSQEHLKLTNPVKPNLLTWTAQAAQHAF